MPGIIHKFEEHKFTGGRLKKVDYYKTPYSNVQKDGEGIGDIFSSIATAVKPAIDFAKNNKDLLAAGAKAVGSIAGGAKAIADAKRAADELKQAEIVNQIRNRNLEKQAQEKQLSETTKAKLNEIPKSTNPTGSGFHNV